MVGLGGCDSLATGQYLVTMSCKSLFFYGVSFQEK
jgi:hypothetical protein